MADAAVRWGGVLLTAGGLLVGAAIFVVSLRPVINQPLSPTTSLLLLIAAILLLLSLPAMYARQANAAGGPGLVGYALLQAGVVLIVVFAATPILYPSLRLPSGENVVVFLLGIALILGLLLTGVATIRAGVFPRGAGILLLAATVGFVFVFFVAEFLPAVFGQVGSAFFGVVLGLALGWIGVSMLSGVGRSTS